MHPCVIQVEDGWRMPHIRCADSVQQQNRTGQVRADACKVVCIQIDTLCAVAQSNWKDVVAACGKRVKKGLL